MATNTSVLKTFAQETRKKLISLVSTKIEFILTQDTAELRGFEPQISKLKSAIAEKGKELIVEEWKKTVVTENQSIGDAAIVQIAQQFAPTCEVEIFTGDGGLKNYEYKIQGQAKKELRRNRNKGK